MEIKELITKHNNGCYLTLFDLSKVAIELVSLGEITKNEARSLLGFPCMSEGSNGN
ncbi:MULTISPECIES: hypothetical protein [Vibrio]|uniref:hypothetical protein n=1 Tax=Vibrio TaxID=662 RepID=UPI0029648D15|nr:MULTISPECIES: hypothetical protein [unclassified Vibrio]MDW1671103.1 hypothetical protein [Vibrio sp. Vb2610]MDW1805047.1 hypothetical protein [Vibrio sp. Vb2628]